MNVQEIQAARSAAEQQILEIVRQFEAATGLQATVVGMRHSLQFAESKVVGRTLDAVELEAKLP